MAVSELHGDAEVIVKGKLVAIEHLRPGEAIGFHHRSAGVTHHLAQGTARIDGPVETDGRKEGAEEHLCVGVAPLSQEGHPAAGLLLDLRHGFMLQEVREAHALVAHIVAELQVSWDVHTLRLLGIEAAMLEAVRRPAVVVVLLAHRQCPALHQNQQRGPEGILLAR